MNPHLSRTERSRALLAALLLSVTYAYFYQAGGWNQNSRFALVRAMVERQTLTIDGLETCTGDRANVAGHWYSDKAPGLAFLAAPPVALGRLFGANPATPAGIATLSYVATLATAALPGVLTALLVALVAIRLGAGSGGAWFAALSLGLGTPAWSYSTLLFGHALSAFALFAAFAAADALGTTTTAWRNRGLGFAVGVGGGLAAITEYTTAPVAVLLGLFALHRARGHGRATLVRTVSGMALGVLLTALPLFAYNLAIFGKPIGFGYSYEKSPNWKALETGLVGVTFPKLEPLFEILFGRYRGLFVHAPILAPALLGLTVASFERGRRATAHRVAVLAFAWLLMLNAAYAFWDGGWSHGPRYLVPALPFACLGLAPLWSRAGRGLRGVLAAVAIASLGLNLIVVATTPQPPMSYRFPLAELSWPAFRTGDLSLNHQSFLTAGVREGRLRGGTIPHVAWNLGEKMGLAGLASLVPLGLVWLLTALAWRRTLRHAAVRPITGDAGRD